METQIEGVLELMLCEAYRLVLRPNRLYVFRVHPDCPNCVALGEQAFESYGEPDASW